jgi:hypothetical protein
MKGEIGQLQLTGLDGVHWYPQRQHRDPFVLCSTGPFMVASEPIRMANHYAPGSLVPEAPLSGPTESIVRAVVKVQGGQRIHSSRPRAMATRNRPVNETTGEATYIFPHVFSTRLLIENHQHAYFCSGMNNGQNCLQWQHGCQDGQGRGKGWPKSPESLKCRSAAVVKSWR